MKMYPIRLLALLMLLSSLDSASFAQRGEPRVPPRPIFQPKVAATVSNQQPGSILVFPYFAYGNGSLTEITLSNTHESATVQMRLFYVLQTGRILRQTLVLPVGSTKLVIPDFDEVSAAGFLFAVAVNEAGIPIGFNYLIGSEFVKLNSGHQGRLAADAYPALFDGTLPGVEVGDDEALLALDGFSYGLAATVLAVGDVQPTSSTSTVLIVNALPTLLQTSASSGRNLFLKGTANVNLKSVGTQLITPLDNFKQSLFPGATEKSLMTVAIGPIGGLSAVILQNGAETSAWTLHYTRFSPYFVRMPMR